MKQKSIIIMATFVGALCLCYVLVSFFRTSGRITERISEALIGITIIFFLTGIKIWLSIPRRRDRIVFVAGLFLFEIFALLGGIAGKNYVLWIGAIMGFVLFMTVTLLLGSSQLHEVLYPFVKKKSSK